MEEGTKVVEHFSIERSWSRGKLKHYLSCLEEQVAWSIPARSGGWKGGIVAAGGKNRERGRSRSSSGATERDGVGASNFFWAKTRLLCVR